MTDVVTPSFDPANVVQITEQQTKVTSSDGQTVVVPSPIAPTVITAATQGPPGPSNLFIQASQPVVDAGVAFLWIQTGLGDGQDASVWYEDGT